jgi:glycosyltransferase A (GT-A) superfamily protein (DUF2064 family)
MMEDNKMFSQVTIEQVEQQIVQLSPNEQLKLIARIAEQLGEKSAEPLKTVDDADTQQQRKQEADELLALCNVAAELWTGDFDAAEDIRQMRQKNYALRITNYESQGANP